MTEKEMIEEMTKVIHLHYWGTCAKDCCDECQHNHLNICKDKIIAEKLYNAGYRKVPEGAVVLTEDTAEDVANMILNSSQLKETMDRLIKDWQKETAMEFVKETVKRKRTLIIPYTNDKVECISTYWIYKLAKQFGVEIEG